MKKAIIIGIAFMLFMPSLTYSENTNHLSSFISENNGNNGKTLHVGGDGPNNYTSIQSAINNAKDGDTVFVYDDSSPYYENIVIDKSINLIGENKDTTVIEGKNDNVIHIKANDADITGFTIQSNGSTYAAIYLDHSNNTNIHSLIIQLAKKGIHLLHSNNVTLSNNIIYKCSYGIYNLFSNSTIIRENILKDNDHGVEISHSKYIQIENNNISKNNYAIFLDNSLNTSIKRNLIKSNNVHAIYLFSSKHSVITGNCIDGNKWGILIDNADDLEGYALIQHNNISNNVVCGIQIDWSFGNKIVENNISYNDVGIRLISSIGAVIMKNNFFYNRRHVYFEKFIIFGVIPLNLIHGNFWGRPHIFPKIIFGKLMPGNIPWVQFDWMPRLFPYRGEGK